MSETPDSDLIHPIRPPREVAPGYRGSLAIPDGIVWYRHRSEEDQDHQHIYDQLSEMDDELREAFELEGQVRLKVPYAKQPGGSVSDGLRRVTFQYGPAGAVPFLGKLVAENSNRYKALVGKSQMTCADKGKGKERASDMDDEMQGEMTEEEMQQLDVLREVRRFVSQQEDHAGVGSAVNDKMGRLLDLLKRFSRGAKGKRNAARGRCFLVVQDDLMVKTLHKLLEYHSISVASLSTEQLSMPGSDVWKLDFAEADYSVLIVPVVVNVKWELARCNIVHYDLIGSEAVKTMPLQKSQKRPGHRFYVFKAEGGDQRDIRLEEDYGLQLDPRTKPEEKSVARLQLERWERNRLRWARGLSSETTTGSSDSSSDEYMLDRHDQNETRDQAEVSTRSNEAREARQEAGRSSSEINMPQSEEEEFKVDDSLMRDDDVPDSPPRPLHLTCRADNVPLPLPARRSPLTELGLPSQGFQWTPQKKNLTYTGPRGRTLCLRNIRNPYFQRGGRKKGQTFSCLQLTNNRSDSLVSNRSASKVFDDVAEQVADRGYGDITMRETVSTVGKGSLNAKAYAFDSPPVLGLDTIISDSGKRTGRARDYAYLTYIAALYMAGWLDDYFEFVPEGPDRSEPRSEQHAARTVVEEPVDNSSSEAAAVEEEAIFSDSGLVQESEVSQIVSSRDKSDDRAVPTAAPLTAVPSARPSAGETSSPNLRPKPIAPWNVDITHTMSANQHAGPSTGHHAGTPARSTAGLPARPNAGFRSGPLPSESRKLDAHDASQQSLLEGKQPKFWTACTPLSAGSFCATLCRIKPDEKQAFDKAPRAYRTMCILTRHRFSLPMNRRLPTCRGVVVVDARLHQGRDVRLDDGQLRMAEAYTLKLFSIPRRRQVSSAPGELPYLILPMSREWDLADKATSEMKSSEKNTTKDLAWREIIAALASTLRPTTGLESGGQGLAVLAEESVYTMSGQQYNEVVEIRRDEHARFQAEGRALAEASRFDWPAPVVSGPVFKLRLIPDFWKPGHRPRDRDERYVCPKSEPVSTVAKSIYHSAHMLPWMMWTIDGLLLAQEVNMKYLGSRADTYDVLAALSTTASLRHVDCEVLEFAGDTYWKLAATAYHFHTSPTSEPVQLSKLVRSVTDNRPLANGMEECGAVDYILNSPVDPTTFVPPGCGYQNPNEGHVTIPPVKPTLLHRKSIADVAEALAGAIGKLKEHELILQTCMRLFPSSFPSPIAWRDISQTSASPDYGRIVASADAVATFANITGYSFNNPYLLGLTLSIKNREAGNSAVDSASKLTFLGSAIFDYMLMSYLIEQGSIQKLGPGQLTRWRSPMSSHVGLAALWVTSGLHRVAAKVARQPVASEKQVPPFEQQLHRTIETHTELSLAWTTIKHAPRVEDHIYSLFAGVLIDSGWCFDATRAFFNRLCLPFFASFVGKYEQDRLMPILEPVAANRKLQLFLACSMVGHRLQRGGDGLYRALVECHGRLIGDASSVYAEAAQGFAYRDALSASADPVLANELRRICLCSKPNRPPRAETKRGAGWVETRPKPAGPPVDIRQAVDKGDESSDDGFEIIENPNLVIRRPAPVAPAIRKAGVLDLTGSEDSDGQQTKKQRHKK